MPDLDSSARSHRDAIVITTLALMAIGLVMIASAGASLDRSLWDSLRWSSPFGRQVVFGLAGVATILATVVLGRFLLDNDRVRRSWPIVLFALAVVGLAATLIPGIANPHRGSQRWLQVVAGGVPISIQPSELAKLALVAVLAWLLGGRSAGGRVSTRRFLVTAALIAVCVALVGTADFGTSALLAVVGGMMLLVGGCSLKHIFAAGTVGIIGLAGLLYFEPYRLERISAFLSLGDDPLGAGYQPLQSLATIASGGWTGVGLGAGIQKYGYLPEAHTDFIFSIICEETGLLGAGLVIALLMAFVVLGLRATWRASSPFDRLLAFGITSIIGWQAVMNIAVVTVVAPTTGISLPFVSAGGSGLLTLCASAGLLAAVAARGKAQIATRNVATSPDQPIRFAGNEEAVTG